LTQSGDGWVILPCMKHLPSALLIGALVLALHAETPPPKSTGTPPPEPTGTPQPTANGTPEAKPTGDPFVKNPGDTAANGGRQEEDPPNVLIVFEAYSLERNEAAGLLEAEADGAARYRRILEMTKAGKAHLQTLTAIATRSGQRAVTEAIDEVRYALQFTANIPMSGPTPTSWETRNAGDTLEVEPVAEPDGHFCDLNLVPSRVTLARFFDLAGSVDDAPTSQPLFNSQRVTTSVTTDEGTPYYLGTFSPPPAQGAPNNAGSPEVWLAFLHTSIQKSPVPNAEFSRKGGLARPPFAHEVAVNLEYSCYSLDRADAREVLVPPPALDAAWDKVHGLAAEKKAQLEFITSLRTKSGQRAVVEESHEVRMMTEYNPPSIVGPQYSGVVGVTFPSSENAGAADRKVDTSSAAGARSLTRHQVVTGWGTKFETRSAGINVEVEPVIRSENGSVDLNEVVQNVRYLGTLKVSGVGAQYQPQPLFQTSKLTTSQSVLSGKHTLIGTFNPPGADGVNEQTDSGRTWLLFVRVTIVTP